MKLINGRFFDKNWNSWAEEVGEAEAKRQSESLVNCRACWDCLHCRDCQECWKCQECRACRACRNCLECRDCQECWACRACRNCLECRDWEHNPQRIVSGQMGSRNDYTTVYFDAYRTEVVCGCFRGTMEKFASEVDRTHSDNEHARAYRAFIRRVQAYIAECKEG